MSAAAVAPRVRAVVLNWNGGRLVGEAVDALLASDWPAGRLEVVVVDNASTDGSDVALAGRRGVEVRRSPTNAGFPANNLALRDLDGVDYVALVNNDAFVDPAWLAPLVEALEADERLGAACPKLVFAPRFIEVGVRAPVVTAPGDPRELSVRLSGVEVDGLDRWRHTWFGPGCHGPEAGGRAEPHFRWLAGEATVGLPLLDGTRAPCPARLRLAADRPVVAELRWPGGGRAVEVGPGPRWFSVEAAGPAFDVVQNAGSLLLEGGYGADRGFLQRDDGRFDEPVDVWAWCGGGVLLRPAYLADVGLFDERFFLYYEDTDLAWRGRARGWAYRYVPRSVIRHLHATSAGEGSATFDHYVERNRLVMLTKNAPRPLVRQALGAYLVAIAGLARADLARAVRSRRPPHFVGPRRRLGSLVGYLGQLPHSLAERRRLRARRTVPDDELLAWAAPRSSHPF